MWYITIRLLVIRLYDITQINSEQLYAHKHTSLIDDMGYSLSRM